VKAMLSIVSIICFSWGEIDNPVPAVDETQKEPEKKAEEKKDGPQKTPNLPGPVDKTKLNEKKESKLIKKSKTQETKLPRRRRRSRLSSEEQKFIDKHRQSKSKNTSRDKIALPPGKALKKSHITENMKLEVVDEPIQNVFRLISKSYKINIVPESDLGDMRITIHLEDIPVREGLLVICRANGLEMNEVRGVIYISKASEKAIAEMKMYSKRIDINVENKPVKEFIKEFSKKTSISIVPDQDLEGKVTGYIKNILPLNGFKALMAANNYNVRQKGGVYLVEKSDSEVGVRSRRRRGQSAGSGSMDINISDGLITVSLAGALIKDVVREITGLDNMDMVIYGEINGTIDAEFKNVSSKEALKMILQGTRYTYIIKNGIALIGEKNPKTPSGKILATLELYPLKYIRVKEAVKLIPKTISEGNFKAVPEQNAVLLTGTAEEIDKLKEFLDEIDLPIPEVLIEVVIIEYDRSKSSDFGIDKGAGITDGPSLAANVNITNPEVIEQSIGPFTGTLGFLPQNWSLNLRSSLSKTNGKILAMPKLTTLNGNKAHLRVRKTKYYPVTTFNKEGSQSTDFRSIDDGITIDLTPYVTQHGEVNLEIKPSIKTSAPSGGNRPDDVTDRSINTSVRLLDGQTIVLGGLIESKESEGRTYVPILGQIPFIGYFFSWRGKTTSTTEMVIYVTPHILKADNIGVNLEDEFKSIEGRKGFIENIDFFRSKEKTGESIQETEK